MVFSDSADFPALPDWTEIWQETFDWVPTPTQMQHFQMLYHLILEGNQRLNLTRITEPLEFLEKHLWDSLSGIQQALTPSGTSEAIAATPAKVIDIGTGAGFPGLPIAIVQPAWSVTLLDSTRKKLTFLDQVISDLGLSNAKTLVGRVEAIGQDRQHRGHYDLAMIRAVAGATVCAEYALPLLKVGGTAVLYRGQWTTEEQDTLASVIQELGGTIDQVIALKTPITHSDRHCIHLRKTAPTPVEFPRPTGIPTQKPLGIESTLNQ